MKIYNDLSISIIANYLLDLLKPQFSNPYTLLIIFALLSITPYALKKTYALIKLMWQYRTQIITFLKS